MSRFRPLVLEIFIPLLIRTSYRDEESQALKQTGAYREEEFRFIMKAQHLKKAFSQMLSQRIPRNPARPRILITTNVALSSMKTSPTLRNESRPRKEEHFKPYRLQEPSQLR